MVTENKEKKILRLANWQVYFIERLHQLYTKSDLCDVTLKFSDNTAIQAHKVVLRACTNFFDLLPSSSAGVVLHMPKTMKAHHVRTIINFMYTGKLEYMPDEQNAIFLVAKQLGMTVLTELLQIQPQLTTVTKQNDMRMVSKKYVHKVPTTPVQNEPPQEASPPPTSPPPTETTPSAGLPGKKLPIWKKRTSVQLPDEFYRSVHKKPLPLAVPEIPKPTRFEWPEEDLPDVNTPQSFTMDSFEHLSYDSKIIVTPCHYPKPVISEDSIERMPDPPQMLGKRSRVSEVIRGHTGDEDDYDDGHFESIHDMEDDMDDEELTIVSELKPISTPPKPILKTVSSPSPSKKVRFAMSSEVKTAENIETQANPPPAPIPLPLSQMKTTTSTATTTPSTTTGANSFNHAKIINEVLKKFPDLTKNKNIKLKIQTGNTPTGSSTPNNIPDKDGKGQTKVQYIVLKSDITNLKKDVKPEPAMGAENTTGPWICVPCADDKGPIHFDTYYKYRKHLQEVHNERIDARICEHCGFKASKRNLHLYHLYTKHNIPPPRNIHFPKCDQCSYIALSESLLIKHRSNHTGMVNKEYVCRLCNAAFKSHGALMGHMQTNLHQTDQAAKKDYECEYCGKIFNRNINLKAHIRTSHQEESIRKFYDDEDKIDDPSEVEVSSQQKPQNQNQNVMEVIEVPVFDSVPGANKTLYLPPGMTILAESPAVPLMPSSESEAMSNVATGIATSINITDRNMTNDVIVIDNGGSEIILRGTPTTYVLNPDGSYSLQEYIVPEIMADSGQVYTTALVSTAPATGISYVNSDNISIISASDHTYADGMKINGHVSSSAQVNLVSPVSTASHVPVSQANQPIIVQEPIIVNSDWVQTIATSQDQSLSLSENDKVEMITTSLPQVQAEAPAPAETAQTLVNDWGDLDEDNQDESQDGEDESEKKPSRPTIELDVNTEMDM